ncbi:MAG: hypothetical protein FJ088_05535 [Deltaproteobacteria bacterium]|nr:hypothetical protein [Deltaproteobacteria bacterium]
MRCGFLFWLAAFFAFWGCKAGDREFFKIELSPLSVKTGESKEGEFRIIPQAGYKWNPDFRASAALTPPSFVEIEKKALDSKSGGISEDGGAGVVKFGYKGAGAGKGEVGAVLSFSVCNEDECKIFKGEKTGIPVEVF